MVDGFTWNMLIGKLDVDDVGAWFRRFVRNTAGTILIVMAFNISLAWAFNGQTQTSVSC